MTKGKIAGVVAALAVAGTGLGVGLSSCGTANDLKQDCWTPAYAAAHNTSGAKPAPRHGASKTTAPVC